MAYAFSDIAFTPTVKALQEQAGSRESYARMEAADDDRGVTLTSREAAFLAERDSFYMATVGEAGWPYVQHRAARLVSCTCSTSARSDSPISPATGNTSASAISPTTTEYRCSS
jgi:hypothetical protein